MLIVTAGHIDHGKTALVRALTGAETDRLPEEKARGISIDLGFAYWRRASGPLIGFVDVPGHERYIGNMLAGLAGVDFALLVVAADDGVMPQTCEHLRMLDLMGLTLGCVALTKCDKVNADRCREAGAEITGVLARTGLKGSPVFPVSSLTGQGIAELAEALGRAALAVRGAPQGAVRLAIDRCFSVVGAGTVVTGAVLGGTLSIGDHLTLSPRGLPVRVRGLQVAGEPSQQVAAGQRCAVNLAGVEVAQVHRGDWLLAPGLHAPTSRLEARIRVEAGLAAPLRHGTALRLHLGTAEIPARMLTRRQMPIAPGESALAALALERPACAINGERFILRDASGRMLIGGGRIVDPFAPPRFRKDDGRPAVLAALELHDPRASLAALLAGDAAGIDCAWFERSFGLPGDAARQLYEQAGGEVLGKAQPVVMSASRLTALCETVPGLLAACHRERPEAGGMTAREIGKALGQQLSGETLAAILRRLADRRAIEFSGPLVRLPGHSPSFGAAEVAAWRAMLDWLEPSQPRTITPAELANQLGGSEASHRAMLFRRRSAGDLWAVDDARFMLPGHVAALAASAAILAERHPQGFSAAQFRDASGIGRNHVIRLLEFFDRSGITARRGEQRVMRAGWQAVAGDSPPWLAGE